MIKLCAILILLMPLIGSAKNASLPAQSDSAIYQSAIGFELAAKRHYVSVGMEILGVNYYGFAGHQNISLSGKFQTVQLSLNRQWGITESINLGTTFGEPIGYTCIGVSGLHGRENHYLEIGCSGALAFTEHYVHWNDASHGGGVAILEWGLQIAPHIGYMYLSAEKHFVFRAMFVNHYWLRTFELPGPMDDHVFWLPIGFCFAYKW